MKFICAAIVVCATIFASRTFAQPAPTTQPALQQILIAGEDWRIAGQGYRSTDGPAANASGEVFFNDGGSGKTFKIGLDGTITAFLANSFHASGEAFGPDGRLYALSDAKDQIIAYDMNGKGAVIAEHFHGNDLVVAANGNICATSLATPADAITKLWLFKPNGERSVVDEGLTFYNGLTLSPDQTLVYAGDYRSHWVYGYKIQPDGSLTSKHQFFDLSVPAAARDSAADGMRVDADGRLYVTTRSGIQICDPAGKTIGILPMPNGKASNLSFGGVDFDTLFVTSADKVYSRKLKVRGIKPIEAPHSEATPKP